MTAIGLVAAAAGCLLLLIWLLTRPRPRTLAEEEALLRDYFRKIDRR